MRPGLSQTFCKERGDSYEGRSDDISKEVNFGWKRENHMHKLQFSNDACHSKFDLVVVRCTFAKDARVVFLKLLLWFILYTKYTRNMHLLKLACFR